MLLIGFMAACGGNGGGEGSTAAEKNDGETFENDFFKAIIPGDWTVFDDSKVKMMQIYPKNDSGMYKPTIHLKFEGNGNWHGTPEGSIAGMAKNYKGSAPEKVVINGIEYYKTTYEYGGQKQTMMVTKKDGNKITVTMVGKDYDKNPAIPKILETISYK
jgi:hypothetical protein